MVTKIFQRGHAFHNKKKETIASFICMSRKQVKEKAIHGFIPGIINHKDGVFTKKFRIN